MSRSRHQSHHAAELRHGKRAVNTGFGWEFTLRREAHARLKVKRSRAERRTAPKPTED